MKADSRRSVLLHLHLFKNAGSTFDWSLQQGFGSAFCDHRDDAAMRGKPTYLRTFLEENEDLRALSSHWLPLPVPPSELVTAHTVVLLRDPIERMASVYAFERRQQVEHAGTAHARSMEFGDYVRWRLEPGTGPVIRNYQMRMLSGNHPGPDSDAQLEVARAALRNRLYAGLVHRYDESMCLLEHELGGEFPNLDLAYRRQNVSDPADDRSLRERRRDVEAQLGDLREAALAANARDMALFAAAESAFTQRRQALPKREKKLAAFRERCAALASTDERG